MFTCARDSSPRSQAPSGVVLFESVGGAEQSRLAARGQLLRHYPQPGRRIAATAERLAPPDRCQRGRVQHSDSWNGGEQKRAALSSRARIANFVSSDAIRRSNSRHSVRMSAIRIPIRSLSGTGTDNDFHAE
jgi:hypothetical protein